MRPETLSTTAPRDHPSVLRKHSGTLVLGGILTGTLIIWASAFVAIPIGLESVHPIPMINTRMLISSMFLFPFLVRDWKSCIKPRLYQDYWKILLMAGTGIFLYLLFLTYGQRTVGAGQTSFIINLTPLTAGFFAALLLGEALYRRMIAGALVALLGVSFLVFQNGSGFSFNFDAVLVFLAMVSSSIFYVIQRQLSKHYHPATLAALTMVIGTLMFLPFFPGTLDALEGMTTRSAQAILYLGIGTVFPYIGWAYVLSKLPVGKAALFLYSIPVLSTLMGWLVLDEAVTPNLIFAGALIVLGVMIGTGVVRWRPLKIKKRLFAPAPKACCPETCCPEISKKASLS